MPRSSCLVGLHGFLGILQQVSFRLFSGLVQAPVSSKDSLHDKLVLMKNIACDREPSLVAWDGVLVMEVRIRPAREADVLDIAQIYVDTWRTAYASFMPADFLKAMDYDEEARGVLDFAFDSGRLLTLQVAVVDKRIVGYICAGKNTDQPKAYDAEVYEIFVLSKYQGKGIGRRLLQSVIRWFEEEGFASVLIWCWENNPHRAFYEALGGRIVHSAMQTVDKTPLNAVVYGWELDKLHEATSRQTPGASQTQNAVNSSRSQ